MTMERGYVRAPSACNPVYKFEGKERDPRKLGKVGESWGQTGRFSSPLFLPYSRGDAQTDFHTLYLQQNQGHAIRFEP